MMNRMAIHVCLILLMVILLPSCASRMTIEEAKKVSVDVNKASAFVPPPRRIDDIAAVLNQPGKFEGGNTEAFVARAKLVVPKTRDAKVLADFYKSRGQAAQQLGWSKQALDDFREAYRYADLAGIKDEGINHQLATMERVNGNFKKAIALEEMNLAGDAKLVVYGRLVEMYAQIGDLEAAGKMRDRGSDQCGKLRMKKREHKKQLFWCDVETERMESALLEARGKYRDAESHIRTYMDLFYTVTEKNPINAIRARSRLAKNLMQQGRLLEAEIEARQVLAESLAHGGKLASSTAGSVLLLSSILRNQGRNREAEILARIAIDIVETVGTSDDSQQKGAARMNLGNILFAEGNFYDAIAQYDKVKEDLKENRFLFDSTFSQNPNYLVTLIMTGRSREALTLIQPIYEKTAAVFGERHIRTAEILAIRGMAHFRMKNHRQAFQDFHATAPKLMSAHTRRKGDTGRFRLKLILDDYIRLLDAIRASDIVRESGTDAVAAAFQVAEAVRGQSVQAALAASSARAAIDDPAVSGLIRREQDTAKEIEALENILKDVLALPQDQQNSRIKENIRGQIENLRQALQVFTEEIGKRAPKHAEVTHVHYPTLAVTRKHLRPGESLISIYTSGDRTYVWALPVQGSVRFSSVPLSEKELKGMVVSLRHSLDCNPETFRDIPDFNAAAAHDLYRLLLAPVEDAFAKTDSLLIVTGDMLDQIPLSILVTKPQPALKDKAELFDRYRHVPWLIRQYAVTMLPSVSSLETLRTSPVSVKERRPFIGFGDPLFNPRQATESGNMGSADLAGSGSGKIHVRGVRITAKGNLDSQQLNSTGAASLSRLPDTAEEIRTIARTVGADPVGDVFLGSRVTEKQVKEMDLSDRRIIAFATHALIPGDLDGLDQPALALSSPSVTGEQGDGLLKMDEVMKLKLNADWVVLSACNTAAADGQGAEALSGLGRAFFYAGTKSILASMYPVETTSAKKLVTGLFEAQKSDQDLSRAQALRRSMMDLIDDRGFVEKGSGKIVSSYAHPLFWAPFIIVGDGSGSMK